MTSQDDASSGSPPRVRSAQKPRTRRHRSPPPPSRRVPVAPPSPPTTARPPDPRPAPLPEQMEKHRQHGDRISDRPDPGKQALRLGEHRPQTLRHRLTPHPRVPVVRQPAQIRRQHRTDHPDPLVVPADPGARHGRSRELRRVLRLDQLVRTHVQHHCPASPTTHEIVRRVPAPPTPAAVAPRQLKRLGSHPDHLRLGIQAHQVAELHPRLVTHQFGAGRSPVPAGEIALPSVRRKPRTCPTASKYTGHATSSGPPCDSPRLSTYSSQKSPASTSHPHSALTRYDGRRRRSEPLPQVDRDTAPNARD